MHSIESCMDEYLEGGDNNFLRLTSNDINNKTEKIICMRYSTISYIRKNLWRRVVYFIHIKLKKNYKVGEIRDIRKLYHFDHLHLIKYVNHQHLKGKNIIRIDIWNFLKDKLNKSTRENNTIFHPTNIGLSYKPLKPNVIQVSVVRASSSHSSTINCHESLLL